MTQRPRGRGRLDEPPTVGHVLTTAPTRAGMARLRRKVKLGQTHSAHAGGDGSREGVVDVLIRLTDTAGDPVLVNLATCRRVTPISDGVTTVEYTDDTWQRVTESLDDIERLQAGAGPLVDLPCDAVGDGQATLTVAPHAVEWASDYVGHADKCQLRLRGDNDGEMFIVALSREAALAKLGLAHQ